MHNSAWALDDEMNDDLTIVNYMLGVNANVKMLTLELDESASY